MSTTAFGLPHYFANLTGSGLGTATMVLNQSGTGAAVDVFGTYAGGGAIRPFISVSGGLIFNDSFDFPAPNFDFNGTIYFAQPCCGGFSIDTLSTLTGAWIFDPQASGTSGGVSTIDYTFVPDPPADVPEPSTLALFTAGALLLSARAFHRSK